jgi:hypothetical protein
MKHPSEATLALHAGDDLGVLARWRTQRHLARCERCRGEAAAFRALREIAPDLRETPEIAWNRLAAEMKANIRLGLEAGRCVRSGDTPTPAAAPLFFGARALIAVASVLTLMVTGLVLEHPAPNPASARLEGVVVQRMAGGIQVREGGQALRLLHGNARDVTYTVGAQGSLRARYVDPDTGYVTINNVYVE